MGAHPWAGHGCGARPLTSVGEPRLRRLVLIGAGRANLRLLRALSRPIVRGLEIVLVTIDRGLFDPSMTSGLLRGAYALDDVRALRQLVGAGVEGAIIGSALYRGAFTLAEALEVAGRS